MRDILLASIERLVAHHSDGPLAVDDEALWQAIVDAGFARTQIEGESIGLSDALALVSRAAGLGARVPLGDVLLGDWLLSAAGVVDAPPCILAAQSHLRLVAGGQRVSGVVYEAWSAGLSHVLTFAADGEVSGQLVIAELGHAHAERKANMAGEPQLTLRFEDAPVRNLAAPKADIAAIAALARCAQMTGAISRILDLTLEHAATRAQFGKPLAKLQAVQQMQAQIAGEMAMAVTATDRAANVADLEALGYWAAIAKAIVSEAAGKVAALAHQIHGAMGVSREHELQHHTRALWAWRDECGAEDVWRAVIGRRALQHGGEALWPALTQG